MVSDVKVVSENYLSTKDAAEKLGIHVRTTRKWVETFEEYVRPKLNKKGHYILDGDGLAKLFDIKKRIQESGNLSLKKLYQQLVLEGKIKQSQVTTASVSVNTLLDSLNQVNKLATNNLERLQKFENILRETDGRLEQLEDQVYNLFDFMEEMEERVVSLLQRSASSHELKNMFTELKGKQDQLRIELRNVNFAHKLAASTHEYTLPRRRTVKKKFLGIF
ncbi:MAG: hypothetical protein RLZ12_1020 [Bacillota bacterium]|jgi:hypothetical protein